MNDQYPAPVSLPTSTRRTRTHAGYFLTIAALFATACSGASDTDTDTDNVNGSSGHSGSVNHGGAGLSTGGTGGSSGSSSATGSGGSDPDPVGGGSGNGGSASTGSGGSATTTTGSGGSATTTTGSGGSSGSSPSDAGRGGSGGRFGTGGSGGSLGGTGGFFGGTGGSFGGARDAGGGAAGGGSGSSDGGPLPAGGNTPAHLPVAKEACPTFQTGTMTFLGQSVRVWAGAPTADQHGPVVVYWYATGSSPQEALTGLGQAAIDEITKMGGVVLAQTATTKQGTNTGNGVWYTGDFDIIDEAIACAVEKLHVDTRHIHASGFSAGGLQTVWMAYARSGYLASVVPYSGGLSRTIALQDASNVPSAMAVHGATGSDVVVLDFAKASATYESDVKAKGGFAMDCDHGGGHRIPTGIGPSTWRFMKDHPFQVKPFPYAGGVPAGFPSYCTVK